MNVKIVISLVIVLLIEAITVILKMLNELDCTYLVLLNYLKCLTTPLMAGGFSTKCHHQALIHTHSHTDETAVESS